ncbi:MAG: DnaJ domain-containing protein [Gammaproteobacteria bacterium]|nr:DnaJ domain-containing protein [Gammaproteobacteria bacterium]
MIESLLKEIEKVLKRHPEGLSEYELISVLKKNKKNKLVKADLQDAYQLFNVHFIVFHCLYLLRDRWLSDEEANLQISTLKIIRHDYHKSQQDGLETIDELRSYYLDLGNLEKTDAAAAEDLINSFWVKYAASADRFEALAVLELGDDVDYEQVKARYRQLAMKNHPDRGGSDKRLADINKAMETLKRYYKPD